MDLTEFLLARIAEDEEVARRSIEDDARMTAEAGPIEDPGPAYITEQANVGMEYVVGVRPARVLAECEAKRRMVGLHSAGDVWEPDTCMACSGRANAYPCATLRLLALPYADHPDYRDEWRP